MSSQNFPLLQTLAHDLEWWPWRVLADDEMATFVEDEIKEHPQIMLTRVSPMSHQGADVDAKTTFGEILAKRAHLSTLQVHIALNPHKL